jgi:hypothetical protein
LPKRSTWDTSFRQRLPPIDSALARGVSKKVTNALGILMIYVTQSKAEIGSDPTQPLSIKGIYVIAPRGGEQIPKQLRTDGRPE